MPSSRFSILFLAAVASFASTVAVPSGAVRAQENDLIGADQVIAGDELRRRGIVRLGDVMRYLHAGRMITIDGFSRRVSLNGLGSYHEPGPALYVDGHPIDLSLFDSEGLNLLGIPIEAVDRIQILSKPALIYGSFAGRGAIHIHTRPEVEGTRGEAAASAISEVGDPGPFGYLDDVPNVDTQGPDARVLVESGGSPGGIRASAVYRRHYLTKPAILERLIGLQQMADAPVIEAASPSLSVSWGGTTFGGNLIGLGAIGKLYPFLPHASREISVDYRAANVSAVVRHAVAENSALRHRLTFSALRAEQPADSEVPFKWEQESVTLNSAFGRSLQRRVVVLGGTGRLERARSATEADRYTASLYAAIAGRMSEWAQYQGGGMLSTDWTSSALKAYGGVTFQPSAEHRGDLYVSIAEDLPHEQDVVDSWARLGIDVPHLPATADRPNESVSIRATGDAEWNWSPNARHELAGGAGVRVAAQTYAFQRQVRPVGAGFRSAAIAYDYAAGTNGIFWMEYATRLLPGRQRVFWHQETTLRGDALFREIWRAVPDARFGLSVYVPIAPDFEVEASLIRQTGSTWREYESVASSEVNGATLLDASFYKRLFAGRVHLRFGLRNILREEVRFHPLGDVFDLTAQVDLRVEFGTRR